MDSALLMIVCARRYLAGLVTLVLGLRLCLAPQKRYLFMLLKLVGSVHKRWEVLSSVSPRTSYQSHLVVCLISSLWTLEVLFTCMRMDNGASGDLQPTVVLRTDSRVVPHRTECTMWTTQSYLAPYLLDRNGSPYKLVKALTRDSSRPSTRPSFRVKGVIQ